MEKKESKDCSVEVSRELSPEEIFKDGSGGNFTRDMIRQVEQESAKKTSSNHKSDINKKSN